MKKYNNKYIPEAGCCFKYKGEYRFTIDCGKEADEVAIGDELTKLFANHFILGGKFEIVLSENTKKNLIKLLFSNDDQIAIMLNYQDSPTPEHKEMLDLMQDWRRWIGDIISKARSIE